jgi:hypothetical protein
MKLSPSRLRLAEHCAWPFRADVEWTDDGGSQEREFGTLFHTAMHAMISSGGSSGDAREAMRGAIREDVERVIALAANAYTWLQSFAGEPVSEISYAYDITRKSSRMLGRGLARAEIDALCGPTEMHGSCDVVVFGHPIPIVIDWKTGKSRPDIATHPQLRAYALFVARMLRTPVSHMRIIAAYVTENGIDAHEHSLDVFDLLETEHLIASAAMKADGDPPPMPGMHCRGMYCPAVLSCPAAAEAFARLSLHQPEQAITSPSQVAQLIVDVDVSEARAKSAKAAIRRYVDEHGDVVFGDGSVYGRRYTERSSISVNSESMVIISRHIGEHAQSVYKTTASKDAIRKATTEAFGVGHSRASVERAMLEELETAGYVEHKRIPTYGIVRKSKES